MNGVLEAKAHSRCFLSPTFLTAGNLDAFRIGKWLGPRIAIRHDVIDEMTFTGSVRDAEWVKATYENQKADSTYLSFSNFQGPPAFIGSTDVYGKVGESMSPFNISVIGGGVLSYSAVGLPPGVYLNAATGEITGNPVTIGDTPVTITVTGSNSAGEERSATWFHHRPDFRPFAISLQDGPHLLGLRRQLHPD